MPRYPSDLLARAARIRLACFDVDGTLTDGRLFFDPDGREIKAFHAVDGQGLALLRQSGVHLAFITARTSQVALNRAKELGALGFDGEHDKLARVDALCQKLAITRDEVAFMGDDLADLDALNAVGLAVIPANAHTWVQGSAHWCTPSRGGEGAARELCDLILTAQQQLPTTVQARHP